MNTTQPLALQLADELSKDVVPQMEWEGNRHVNKGMRPRTVSHAAAAELRRLHAVEANPNLVQFGDAIARIAQKFADDKSGNTPLGQFAMMTCAATLPLAFGMQMTAMEAQQIMAAEYAKKKGCAA